jgi:hypothetical protein
MTMFESTPPATVAAGHLVLTEPLREQIRERLLAELDATDRRLERAAAHEVPDVDPLALTESAEAIKAALFKLDAGYYGVCESCEEQIPFERLDAIPSARSCVGCQARPRRLLG